MLRRKNQGWVLLVIALVLLAIALVLLAALGGFGRSW